MQQLTAFMCIMLSWAECLNALADCTETELINPVSQPLTLQHRRVGRLHHHHLWRLAQVVWQVVCIADPVPDALLQVGRGAEASHQEHLQV